MSPPNQARNRPLAYQRQSPAESAAADLYFPDKPRDLIAPIVLLSVGVLLALLVFNHWTPGRLRAVVILLSTYMVFRGIVLTVTIPILTQIAGMSFGIWAPALLKLAAVSVFPESIAMLCILLAGPCYGIFVGLFVGFVVSSILFMKLFELDWAEARLCVALSWAVTVLFNGVWWGLSGWVMRHIM